MKSLVFVGNRGFLRQALMTKSGANEGWLNPTFTLYLLEGIAEQGDPQISLNLLF